MKKIYLLVFQGKGFRDTRFQAEDALIRAGHLGICFEGDERRIIGFHPTEEAIAEAGGIHQAINILKEQRGTLEGRLYDDYPVFARAHELAQLPPLPPHRDTTVYRYTIEVSDDEFERIRQQLMQWYTMQTSFNYSFPPDEPPLPPDRDNCASFMRKLGHPELEPFDPEHIGQISEYVKVLNAKPNPDTWAPEG